MSRIITMLERYTEYELKVSDLYMLYSKLFPEDGGFWYNMSMEEQDHASLIKSSIVYEKLGRLPEQMAYDCTGSIDGMLERMNSAIEQYSAHKPERCVAYRFALEVETSPCEEAFRRAMDEYSDDRVMQIIQSLADKDRAHSKRIDRLMEKMDCPG